MRDVTYWSVSCGRGADVDVRLHAASFIALAAVWHGARQLSGDWVFVGLSVSLVLIGSLALHELAHVMSAWKRGGRVDCIVLGPTGGLTHYGAALEPRGDLMTALAGPAANFTVLIAALLTLLAAGRSAGAIFFPFAPPAEFYNFSVVGVLTQVAWINWLLVLVNVLPTYPFDGARVVAALVRERTDDTASTIVAGRVGLAASTAAVVASWFVADEYAAAALLLCVVGILGAFCSYVEMRRAAEEEWDEESPYQASAADDSDLRRPQTPRRVGPLRRWWQRRQEAKLQLRLKIERDEEERADEVLARLHITGLDSLSPQDRALLQRVSARFRRQRQ